jgi:hypothetical protein
MTIVIAPLSTLDLLDDSGNTLREALTALHCAAIPLKDGKNGAVPGLGRTIPVPPRFGLPIVHDYRDTVEDGETAADWAARLGDEIRGYLAGDLQGMIALTGQQFAALGLLDSDDA